MWELGYLYSVEWGISPYARETDEVPRSFLMS